MSILEYRVNKIERVVEGIALAIQTHLYSIYHITLRRGYKIIESK